MAVASRAERMKRDVGIGRRRQSRAKARIVGSEERIDPIELAKEPPRTARLVIGKQLADLARINRMRTRNDTPPRNKPRQLESRHQLD